MISIGDKAVSYLILCIDVPNVYVLPCAIRTYGIDLIRTCGIELGKKMRPTWTIPGQRECLGGRRAEPGSSWRSSLAFVPVLLSMNEIDLRVRVRLAVAVLPGLYLFSGDVKLDDSLSPLGRFVDGIGQKIVEGQDNVVLPLSRPANFPVLEAVDQNREYDWGFSGSGNVSR